MSSVERLASGPRSVTHFVRHSKPIQIAITVAVVALVALIFGAFVVAAQHGCNLGGLNWLAKEMTPTGINLGMGVLSAILAIDSAVMLALVYSHLNPKIDESKPQMTHPTEHSVKKPSSLIPSGAKNVIVSEKSEQYTIKEAKMLIGEKSEFYSLQSLSDDNPLLVHGEYVTYGEVNPSEIHILVVKVEDRFERHYFKTQPALRNFCTLNNLKDGYAREIAQSRCVTNIGPLWQSQQTGRDYKTPVLFVFNTPDKDTCCFVTYSLETIDQRNVAVAEMEKELAELEKENQIVRQHEWSSKPLCQPELSQLDKEIKLIHDAFMQSQEPFQIHTMEAGLYTAVLARESEPKFFRANDPKCLEMIAELKNI